jgi:tetratricopeptide (TPR) repeat protein
VKRWLQLAFFLTLTESVASAATWQDCRALRLHGKDATPCFTTLTRSTDPAIRAEGFWGLKQWEQANAEFRQALQANPSPAVSVRWGLLLHERFNDTEAADLFHEALAKDPSYAPAYYALALVGADGFDGRAPQYLAKALELDPKSVPTHELAADMALEDSDTASAIQQADAALALAPDALDAMAIHAAVELLADRSPKPWLDRMEAVNPHNGEPWSRIAYHLVQNRRYQDGVAYYRIAIERDPNLWSAHSQLGINLMRLGQQEEPARELQLAYDHHFTDTATVNSLQLLDSYKNFVTIKDETKDQTTILRLNRSEAELLRPYFQEQLHKAMATYNAKYKMTLPRPVQVEVYPEHEDFAVRTTGLPGLGALGVTFGEVVAMDSPSARKPGDFHWAATLWHELSHVYILTATNERVPRWFTEGLAVHEESQASPEWGDRVTPDILQAMHDKKLLPVETIDRGFIYPEYPSQVVVSYFEAGSMCDYIAQRWGEAKLLDLVHAFASETPTPQVIASTLGEPAEQFDKDFFAWFDHQFGPQAAHLDAWKQGMAELSQAAKAKDFSTVVSKGETVKALYPQYIGDANAYEFIAQAQLAQSNKPAAIAALTQYQTMGGHDPSTLKQLAALEEEAGDKAAAAATLDRLNLVYPVADEDLHRHLGHLWMDQKNYPGAIREFGSVLALHPLDQAQAQYDLASAYLSTGDKDKAEQADLLALEAAPGFRPAQKLLLELHAELHAEPTAK